MTGKKVSPSGDLIVQVWKLTAVLLFGLVALEILLEVGFSTSLTGSSRGPLIKSTAILTNVEIVNTPKKQNMLVARATSLYARPSLKANKVAKLAVGTTLKTIAMTTVGKDDVWHQTLRFGGKIGYVHGTDVRPQ